MSGSCPKRSRPLGRDARGLRTAHIFCIQRSRFRLAIRTSRLWVSTGRDKTRTASITALMSAAVIARSVPVLLVSVPMHDVMAHGNGFCRHRNCKQRKRQRQSPTPAVVDAKILFSPKEAAKRNVLDDSDDHPRCAKRV